MKAQQSISKLFLGSIATICALVLAGCATMESASQESLLQKAGFQSRTPTTRSRKRHIKNFRLTSSIASR